MTNAAPAVSWNSHCQGSATVPTDLPQHSTLRSIVATWLKGLTETETDPQEVLMWHANWSSAGTSLRGTEHLAMRISVLRDEEFGGVTGHISGRWVQVMRVARHWIVEVRHETMHWPRRVYWGDRQDWPGKLPYWPALDGGTLQFAAGRGQRLVVDAHRVAASRHGGICRTQPLFDWVSPGDAEGIGSPQRHLWGRRAMIRSMSFSPRREPCVSRSGRE